MVGSWRNEDHRETGHRVSTDHNPGPHPYTYTQAHTHLRKIITSKELTSQRALLGNRSSRKEGDMQGV